MNPLPKKQPPKKTRIIQLTDLHLTGEVGQDSSYHHFLKVLEHAKTFSPDRYILTGDLVNGGDKAGYDWLFKIMDDTGTPYTAIAGNHDVTAETDEHLPFNERTFSPVKRDERLKSFCVVRLDGWRLIFLDSTVAGFAYGQFSEHSLDALKNFLTMREPLRSRSKSTALIFHHHPVPVGSKWLDEIGLKNGNELLTMLKSFPKVRLILHGHTHQTSISYQTHRTNKLTILGCPAVSRQFLPHSDEFALDDAPSGFRLIDLMDNGHYASTFVRLPNF